MTTTLRHEWIPSQNRNAWRPAALDTDTILRGGPGVILQEWDRLQHPMHHIYIYFDFATYYEKLEEALLASGKADPLWNGGSFKTSHRSCVLAGGRQHRSTFLCRAFVEAASTSTTRRKSTTGVTCTRCRSRCSVSNGFWSFYQDVAPKCTSAGLDGGGLSGGQAR